MYASEYGGGLSTVAEGQQREADSLDPQRY
jgi:hypothetical protein